MIQAQIRRGCHDDEVDDGSIPQALTMYSSWVRIVPPLPFK